MSTNQQLKKTKGGNIKMAGLLPPMTKESGWDQLNAPQLHQWDKPGETIAGKLMSIEPVEIRGKRVPQYTLATDSSHRIRLLGTYDLVQKLNRTHIGMLVRIKYLGEDESVKKGDNAMRIFDVHVKKDSSAATHNDGTPITDEDIPF